MGGGGGVLKAKLCEKIYEGNLEFPEGEGVQNKKLSVAMGKGDGYTVLITRHTDSFQTYRDIPIYPLLHMPPF